MIIARSLLDGVWIGALGTIAVSVVTSVRAVSASARHAMWCILLLLIAVTPVVAITGSAVRGLFSSTSTVYAPSKATLSNRAENQVASSRFVLARADAAFFRNDLVTGAARRGKIGLTRLFPVAIGLWLAIAIMLLVRLARSVLALRRLKSSGLTITCGKLLPRRARVLVLQNGRDTAVSSVGYVHPAVLVPERFPANTTADEWNDILTHEGSHLRRFDDVTALLAQVCKALFWFNPIVHYVTSRMSVEREIACDDTVVRETRAPYRYAQTLWKAANFNDQPMGTAGANCFAHESTVVLRLRRLLTVQPQERRSISRAACALIGAFAVVTLVVAALFEPALAWSRGVGAFIALPTMNEVRADHTSTLLLDGNVLITGGMNGTTPDSALRETEIYDVRARTFKPAAKMLLRRCSSSATRLQNGDILIAGGWTPEGVTAEAELYETREHRFVQLSPMNVARAAHTATLLRDGRVLITGGEVSDSNATSTAEIFDPSARRFSMTGSLAVARSEHAAATLNDGRVLIVGGENNDSDLASAEIYDPHSGTFTRAGAMSVPRSKLAAVTLESGRVLVAGGQNGGPRGERLATAELYDPAIKAFLATGSMAVARYKIGNAAVLLRDGLVLIAGGAPFAETYSEKTNRFLPVRGTLKNDRDFGAATLLRDGSVLVTGGYTLSAGTPPKLTNSALLYART